VSTPRTPANKDDEELRVVVDAQIVLTMFLVRRDGSGLASPKRKLLRLLTEPRFHWLWTQDILDDYERGAGTIKSDKRIMRRAEFDRVGFQLFLATLQLWPPVIVSATTLRNARSRISQAPRSAERDLEDAVYLACAVDGDAHLLTTEDSDLRLLGDSYEGVRLIGWHELKAELSKLGFDVD
jgi:predicted nucleic acid-binding protein